MVGRALLSTVKIQQKNIITCFAVRYLKIFLTKKEFILYMHF